MGHFAQADAAKTKVLEITIGSSATLATVYAAC
jgi:hypothetical protein